MYVEGDDSEDDGVAWPCAYVNAAGEVIDGDETAENAAGKTFGVPENPTNGRENKACGSIGGGSAPSEQSWIAWREAKVLSMMVEGCTSISL